MRSRVSIDGVAALGDEQELVGLIVVARALGVELDLGGEIVLGVGFLEGRERRKLRVTQVFLVIGVARALGERRFVLAVGPDEPALFAHDDGGAGVLAHRQNAAGGDIGVLQEVVGDEAVVVGGLGVVDDRPELLEMGGTEEMVNVGEGGLGQEPQRFPVDHQKLLAERFLDAHPLARQLAVGRRVFFQGKQRVVLEGRERGRVDWGVHRRVLA
jgi:hypothetical protein